MASGYYDLTSKTLGKGHYGVVKLGRHCLTGEPVAIKIIEKSRLNKDSLNQLGTEIRILFRLSEYEHPNILKLYQTIDTEDRLFLVTEYCGPHACDLHDYLSRKHSREAGLSEREAQTFFIQVCSAISYCHSMGIVHRDLKPENILVTDYKHMYTFYQLEKGLNHELHYPLLKLIDFGFANQWYPDEKMRTSCGTLAYSAPELLLGEPYDGTKVDVWGLGLMLYILLYGGNPFMQINDNETLTKILDCSFATPIRVNVDYDAVELLRSLIKRNPDKRLPIDAILKHKWLSGVPKPYELTLKYQLKPEQQLLSSKQLPKLAPVTSPTLPSISESVPLKNLNKSVDDDQTLSSLPTDTSEIPNPSCNRTRSLSISRTHSKPTQLQTLTQTRSSINLERLNQVNVNSSPLIPLTPKNQPLYRPTSPDVGGSIALSEEEKRLHDRVLQEMFRLTKLMDSGSSIEASLKNARFAHRLFDQNSIQPSQFGKRKVPTGIIKSLIHNKSSPTDPVSNSGDTPVATVDKLGAINTKLSNDDYIYATYQLTRDRILRLDHEKLNKRNSSEDKSQIDRNKIDLNSKNQDVIPEEDLASHDASNLLTGDQVRNDKGFAKENEGSSHHQQSQIQNQHQHQRKLLQPQHKMRDKFTSFFRSGSTSPSGSFSATFDSSSPYTTQDANITTQITHEVHHEAFCDHNNETTNSSSRCFSNKTESLENSMAYALPLARKCSLVSEESNCPSDLSENQ